MGTQRNFVHKAESVGAAGVLLFAACCAAPGYAQQLRQTQAAGSTAQPADSAVQASPVRPLPPARTVDAAALASPAAGPDVRPGAALLPGEAVRVRLAQSIDSGRLKNGDTVQARLAAPVRTAQGSTLRAGTPVRITVVETVPAGQLGAAGEFSLQAVRVGHVTTTTDTLVYRGRPGPRDVADAAPGVGTDAGLPAGAEIEFHVSASVAPATGPPAPGANRRPSSVNGTAPGAKPQTASSPQR